MVGCGGGEATGAGGAGHGTTEGWPRENGAFPGDSSRRGEQRPGSEQICATMSAKR